jgi:hypothetical protein
MNFFHLIIREKQIMHQIGPTLLFISCIIIFLIKRHSFVRMLVEVEKTNQEM